MGCRVGIHTLKGLAAEDKERLYFAGKESAEKEKKSRKRMRRPRKGFEERLVEEEGAMYAAGAF